MCLYTTLEGLEHVCNVVMWPATQKMPQHAIFWFVLDLHFVHSVISTLAVVGRVLCGPNRGPVCGSQNVLLTALLFNQAGE